VRERERERAGERERESEGGARERKRERESCQHVKCQADNLLEVAKTLAEG
jgi:hypothetical protein